MAFSQINYSQNPIGAGRERWRNSWKEYWLQYADARIDWPSHERIEGKISSQYVWPKLQELSSNGICQSGCILVTHSAGDLIARYVLDNQENWLLNAGLEPLNIVATYDFAGAGGGSELADIIMNVVEGGGLANRAMRYAISLWLGEMPNQTNTGVLNDLRVSNARNIASLSDNRIPRIRFIGNGTEYYKATSVFLPGNDDGVVAAHSACGAIRVGSFNSCSSSLAMNGKVERQSNGVSEFIPAHYPVLMGDGYSHSDVVEAEYKGKLTSSINDISLANGQSVGVETYQESKWWQVSISTLRVQIAAPCLKSWPTFTDFWGWETVPICWTFEMTALARKIGVLSAVVTLGGVLWLDIDLGDEADIAHLVEWRLRLMLVNYHQILTQPPSSSDSS